METQNARKEITNVLTGRAKPKAINGGPASTAAVRRDPSQSCPSPRVGQSTKKHL